MFHVLCTNLQPHYYIRSLQAKTTIYNVGFLIQLTDFQIKTFSTTSSSTTVDYLVNSCGLSSENALLASKKIQLKSTRKPDLVLSILKSYGITDTLVKRIVCRAPKILKCEPANTVKPKVEFLHSLGFSGPEIAEILTSDPRFLGRNLEKTIVPATTFLKGFVSSHENLFRALKGSCMYLTYRFTSSVRPNIQTLRDCGVQESDILRCLLVYPRTLLQTNNRLQEIIEAVKEMGFGPCSHSFFYAVRVMTGLNKTSWEGKWENYRKLGFSNEDILSMFKRQPLCLMSSEDKVMKSAKFLTEKLNWKLSDICAHPVILGLSIESRIIPRYNVLELLNSKGIIKELNAHLLTVVFKMTDKGFLVKYVTTYQSSIPEVVNVYNARNGKRKTDSSN